MLEFTWDIYNLGEFPRLVWDEIDDFLQTYLVEVGEVGDRMIGWGLNLSR